MLILYNFPTGSASHEHQHDANGRHPTLACTTHLAKAFDQYSTYLESARCICRNILERGWSTDCCAGQPKKAPSVDAEVRTANKTGAYAGGRKHHNHSSLHHHHDISRRGRKAQLEADMCCKSDKDDCCSGHEVEHVIIEDKEKPYVVPLSWDVEKSACREHVALAVNGMTCSGCGNKMERTLKAIPGVSSVRVNFVMGHAEFSVNTSINSADEVIRAAEKATSFRCNRMASDDQVLDLLASGSSAKALASVTIQGVTGATILNNKTVRLYYDPTIVGARVLLEKINNLSAGLAPPRDDPSVSSGRKRLYDQLVKTLLSAAFTIPVVVLAWGGHLVNERIRSIISVVLATFVQLIAIPDFYRAALGALIHSRTVEMDMLVVISITAAYVYSVVAFAFRMAGKPLETSEFFETSTLLVTLVILGRLVAAFARIRAVEAVSLRSLQATTAVIVENGIDTEIDARLLEYGDMLKIGPHSAVATDAIVTNGSSEIDESMLTGESAPVFKKEGDSVIAGTINGSGTLTAKLTRLPGKNTVTDIAKLVEEAQNSKPKIQDYADRVASWFVPVVTSVAVIVVIVWLIIGFKVRHYNAGKSISNAITYAVATLAVSCPCALGLAVPMVLVIAGGIAARSGVIVKSAECTEKARKVTDVVFDKTGTITEESLDVMEQEYLIDEDEAVAISKALVAGNKHPVSLAVAKHLAQHTATAAVLDEVRVIPGAGVEAKLEKDTLRAGNPKWTETESYGVINGLRNGGMTLLVITRMGKPIAVFGLRTRLREEAARVIAQLSRRNITIHLVSGDQKRAVDVTASQVGIRRMASQCTPAEKRFYVAGLMAEGKIVMFVGDGTNDAVAVTQADVGVQLGSVLSASDVTRGAADVVLLNGLEGILFLMDISGVSFRRMMFNFAWSAMYNILAILLASGAFVNVRIPPAYAGLGEIVSVVPVIAAAMTMLLKKTKGTSATA
ncbi:hypothetical protein QQS21_006050 [Conoideocrella luteorostrata]|uniref:HMA domain-containing protein n=1 Tax=Conoideocrella luteorostrata TaxID=1105319 RepID=A0AAJ0CRA2_9HYPO|nr:hypothetical protein QQS21_006050 [Conoideocrella luteorostrata]